jgi:predicted nucleic acid-binding protein
MTRLESRKVVDSWALVGWVREEGCAPQVRQFLFDAEAQRVELVMSMINVGEAFYTIAKRNSLADAERFLVRMWSLPIRIISPTQDDIMAAARIKASHAIAFGDAFAIALAKSEEASVITGDEEIRRCGLVKVDWVGAGRKS